MKKEDKRTTKKDKRITILSVIAFFLLVLTIVVFMNVKNSMDLQEILEDSVESQLISISIAAREIIDTDKFASYNSLADIDADSEAYTDTLVQLRTLASNINAKYIYALKEIDGQFYFVFDTDPMVDTRFTAYELSRVHIDAFHGQASGDVMNVQDEFGNFNTGAVPIWKDGQIIGIVATDFEDTYISRSISTARANSIILISVLVLTMAVMLFMVFMLLNRVRNMQKRLHHMAHYDTVTGLPNRQYLLDYLAQIASGKEDATRFALFFIDLDNFKTVNDNAGHDAGDELLRHIATYLESSTQNSKAFRPSAGRLNIAARIGGDEFIQVVSGIDTVQDAETAAQALLDDFTSQTIDRYVEKYGVGLSIGVALYPYHSDDYHVLIKYADTAMYYAKKAGKNRYCIYDDSMSQKED